MSIDYLSTIQTITTLQIISTQTNTAILNSLYQLNTSNVLVATSTINSLSNQSTIYKINTQSTINYLTINLNSTKSGLQNQIAYDISTINYILPNIIYNNNISTQNSRWINYIVYYYC